MPRGRKKSPSDNVLAQSPEMSAEIAPAPAEKADKTENVTDKIPAKKRRKPRTETKKAAASAADNSVKAEKAPEIAKNKTEKVPAKRGRKPRADKEKTAAMSSADNSVKVEAVTEKTIEKTDKSTDKTTTGKVKKARSDKGTTKAATKTKADKGVSKRGKKAETKAAAPAPAEVAEKVSAPADKKKRTSNKKAKANKSEEFVIQSNGNDYTMSDITEKCKNAYRNGTRKQIKSIKVYVKSENNGIRAYYVINDNANGYIDL